MLQNNLDFLSFNSQEELDSNAAQFIIKKANKAIEEKGFFSLVLSGGTSPVNTYKILANEKVDFKNWFIYFGDERCLPIEHPERNSFVAKKIWLSKVNIPKSNIFSIPAELGNIQGSLEYEQILNIKNEFDLVILGFGDDGHTASLFPGHKWDNSKQVIGISNSPKAPINRVTLTPSRLSNTRDILFLISGKSKLQAFKQWEGDGDLPVKFISAKNKIVLMTYDIN